MRGPVSYCESMKTSVMDYTYIMPSYPHTNIADSETLQDAIREELPAFVELLLGFCLCLEQYHCSPHWTY